MMIHSKNHAIKFSKYQYRYIFNFGLCDYKFVEAFYYLILTLTESNICIRHIFTERKHKFLMYLLPLHCNSIVFLLPEPKPLKYTCIYYLRIQTTIFSSA